MNARRQLGRLEFANSKKLEIEQLNGFEFIFGFGFGHLPSSCSSKPGSFACEQFGLGIDMLKLSIIILLN